MGRRSLKGRPRRSATTHVWSKPIWGSRRDRLMALLEVDGIDVFYGRVQALRKVTLRVDEGEIVSLIGSNGAGKTTTLRAISGLTPPSSGQIRLRGEDITRTPAEAIV